MAAILIVEDEPRTAETISMFMRRQGHDCRIAHDGYAGLGLALSETFDVVILDWMLPGLDGVKVCQHVKKAGSAKVVILTARSGVNERVYGLDQGADDYVVKPFSLRELEARVRQLTRHLREQPDEDAVLARRLQNGVLRVDRLGHTVAYEGREVDVTPTELKLLALLMEKAGFPVSRAQLAASLAEPGKTEADLHSITIHLSNLRRKMRRTTGEEVLKTVYGVGYRLD